EKSLSQFLANIFCCLHCIKQLKTENIFYFYSELTQCCFHCIKNNNSCFSIHLFSKKMLQLLIFQVLINSVNTEKISLTQL
ncbi:hypothetical protein EMCG_03113, partial [[Emmonsia] crescens]